MAAVSNETHLKLTQWAIAHCHLGERALTNGGHGGGGGSCGTRQYAVLSLPVEWVRYARKQQQKTNKKLIVTLLRSRSADV